jgi:hypothetical protein
MGRFCGVLWDWGTNRDGALLPSRICDPIPFADSTVLQGFNWRTMS